MDLKGDNSFFQNEKIEQICFGRYQIIFYFSGLIHITAGHKVALMSNEMPIVEWNGERGNENISFNSLLEQKIVTAKLDDKKCLTLKFENGLSLMFFCDSDGIGESYIVHYRNDFEVF